MVSLVNGCFTSFLAVLILTQQEGYLAQRDRVLNMIVPMHLASVQNFVVVGQTGQA